MHPPPNPADLWQNVEKRLEKKAYANFNLYGVTNWETNNYNVYTAQYLKK